MNYRGYWDFDGNQQTGYLHIDNHWEFNSGMEIHTGTNFTQEGVFEPFEIVDGVTVPVGDYEPAVRSICGRLLSSRRRIL